MYDVASMSRRLTTLLLRTTLADFQPPQGEQLARRVDDRRPDLSRCARCQHAQQQDTGDALLETRSQIHSNPPQNRPVGLK